MCEKCRASGLKKEEVELLGEKRLVNEFVAHYEPQFANHGTGVLIAALLQLAVNRIKTEAAKKLGANEMFGGTDMTIVLGDDDADLMGVKLKLEPLVNTEQGLRPRADIAMGANRLAEIFAAAMKDSPEGDEAMDEMLKALLGGKNEPQIMAGRRNVETGEVEPLNLADIPPEERARILGAVQQAFGEAAENDIPPGAVKH